MFVSYQISQWLDVAEWFGLIVILGIFVFCLSAYLSNRMLKEKVKKDKLYQVKNNKNKKKQVFFDVA